MLFGVLDSIVLIPGLSARSRGIVPLFNVPVTVVTKLRKTVLRYCILRLLKAVKPPLFEKHAHSIYANEYIIPKPLVNGI